VGAQGVLEQEQDFLFLRVQPIRLRWVAAVQTNQTEPTLYFLPLLQQAVEQVQKAVRRQSLGLMLEMAGLVAAAGQLQEKKMVVQEIRQ
jgi:hypothetical protein